MPQTVDKITLIKTPVPETVKIAVLRNGLYVVR